jgi:hypothetical protein
LPRQLTGCGDAALWSFFLLRRGQALSACGAHTIRAAAIRAFMVEQPDDAVLLVQQECQPSGLHKAEVHTLLRLSAPPSFIDDLQESFRCTFVIQRIR